MEDYDYDIPEGDEELEEPGLEGPEEGLEGPPDTAGGDVSDTGQSGTGQPDQRSKKQRGPGTEEGKKGSGADKETPGGQARDALGKEKSKAAGEAADMAGKAGERGLPPQLQAAKAIFDAAKKGAQGVGAGEESSSKGPLFIALFAGIIIFFLVFVVTFGIFAFFTTPPSEATETPVENPASGELLTPPNLGQPNELGYYQLPPSPDGSYTIYSCPNHRYGSLELVKVLYTVGTNWAKKHPDRKIKIGDLNAAEGHVSHNNGIDVDVIGDGLMMSNKGYRPDLTTELAMMFFETKLMDHIFYDDPNVVSAINAWAKNKGLPGHMQVIGNHDDHFHIRLNIPKGPFHDPSCKG